MGQGEEGRGQEKNVFPGKTSLILVLPGRGGKSSRTGWQSRTKKACRGEEEFRKKAAASFESLPGKKRDPVSFYQKH